ncbi:MAG TPA: Ig-like domain-containing protein [Gemmatimonadaceae bacterium]|nr:Ig-like domain-containing protein [Gemmatimonadaceae bacterium]
MAAAGACGSLDLTQSDPDLNGYGPIRLAHSEYAVPLRGSLTISASRVHGVTLQPIAAGAIAWSSSDPSSVSIDASGTVMGKKLGGPVTISAVFEGDTARATVMVVADHVEVSPAVTSLRIGETVQLAAVAFDAAGDVIGSQPITWSVQAERTPPAYSLVASISPAGLLTGVAPGPFTVHATVAGKDSPNMAAGVPSTYDGTWEGVTIAPGQAGLVIRLQVRFNVVETWEMPSAVISGCPNVHLFYGLYGVINGVNFLSERIGVSGTFGDAANMSGRIEAFNAQTPVSCGSPFPALPAHSRLPRRYGSRSPRQGPPPFAGPRCTRRHVSLRRRWDGRGDAEGEPGAVARVTAGRPEGMRVALRRCNSHRLRKCIA